MTDSSEQALDGLRQVAILLQGLDDETSAALVAQLSPRERDAITAQAACLGAVPPGEQQRITSSFLRQFEVGAGQGGVLHDALTLGPNAARWSPTSAPDAAPDCCPRQWIATVPTDLLSHVLSREHAQTTALILTGLCPQQAASVLEMLPSRLQNDVVRRLAEFDVVDEQLVDDVFHTLMAVIECELEKRRARDARHDVLRSILSATSDTSRTRWVAQLAETDAGLASSLSEGSEITTTVAASCSTDTACENPQLLSLMLFDLEPAMLDEIFRRAGDDITLLALAGASSALAAGLLARLPSSRAATMRSGLKEIGPLRLADVRQAQQFLAQITQDLLNRDTSEDPVVSGHLKLSA